MRKYTLALVLWLAFSTTCHAVTFTFETIGGDTDEVDFEATIVSTDGGFPSIDAELSFGETTSLSIDDGASASISYSFRAGGTDIFVDESGFTSSFIEFAFITISPSLLFHSTSGTTNDFSFEAVESSGIWTINFRADDQTSDAAITGRFLRAKVPEPGPIGLILVGLVAIGFRASWRGPRRAGRYER